MRGTLGGGIYYSFHCYSYFNINRKADTIIQDVFTPALLTSPSNKVAIHMNSPDTERRSFFIIIVVVIVSHLFNRCIHIRNLSIHFHLALINLQPLNPLIQHPQRTRNHANPKDPPSRQYIIRNARAHPQPRLQNIRCLDQHCRDTIILTGLRGGAHRSRRGGRKDGRDRLLRTQCGRGSFGEEGGVRSR